MGTTTSSSPSLLNPNASPNAVKEGEAATTIPARKPWFLYLIFILIIITAAFVILLIQTLKRPYVSNSSGFGKNEKGVGATDGVGGEGEERVEHTYIFGGRMTEAETKLLENSILQKSTTPVIHSVTKRMIKGGRGGTEDAVPQLKQGLIAHFPPFRGEMLTEYLISGANFVSSEKLTLKSSSAKEDSKSNIFGPPPVTTGVVSHLPPKQGSTNVFFINSLTNRFIGPAIHTNIVSSTLVKARFDGPNPNQVGIMIRNPDSRHVYFKTTNSSSVGNSPIEPFLSKKGKEGKELGFMSFSRIQVSHSVVEGWIILYDQNGIPLTRASASGLHDTSSSVDVKLTVVRREKEKGFGKELGNEAETLHSTIRFRSGLAFFHFICPSSSVWPSRSITDASDVSERAIDASGRGEKGQLEFTIHASMLPVKGEPEQKRQEEEENVFNADNNADNSVLPVPEIESCQFVLDF